MTETNPLQLTTYFEASFVYSETKSWPFETPQILFLLIKYIFITLHFLNQLWENREQLYTTHKSQITSQNIII